MTNPNASQTVREWLISLGILTTISISRQEAETKLAAYVPLLASRFPPQAFTQTSLEHVAALSPRGFPSYGELISHLSAWWHTHRPSLPQLKPPQPAKREPPTAEQIAQVEASRAALLADITRKRPPQPAPRAHHLSPKQLADAYADAQCTPPINYAEIANGET